MKDLGTAGSNELENSRRDPMKQTATADRSMRLVVEALGKLYSDRLIRHLAVLLKDVTHPKIFRAVPLFGCLNGSSGAQSAALDMDSKGPSPSSSHLMFFRQVA